MNEMAMNHEKQEVLSQRIIHDLMRIVAQERDALTFLLSQFPHISARLVGQIQGTKGSLICSGVGKSGHIAQKLCATFSSLGKPAFFLHPLDALHGDIGRIRKGDLGIFFSKSGTGKELELLIKAFKARSIQSVLITCQKGQLTSLVDYSVILPFTQEAGLLKLAPTTSSTLMMVFGHALALVVSEHNAFSTEDFALFHPHGALGKNLTLKVSYFMSMGEDLPILHPNDSFQESIVVIAQKKRGVGLVVSEHRELLGIITDGDLRRACERHQVHVFYKKAAEIMTHKPFVIDSHRTAREALNSMKDARVTSLVVVENGEIVGLVHIHDLIRAGICS